MRNLVLTFVLGLMAIAVQAQQTHPLEVHTTAQLNTIPPDTNNEYTRVLVSDNDGVIHRRELSTMGDGLGDHIATNNITVANNGGPFDIGAAGGAFGNIWFNGSLNIDGISFLSAPQNNVVIGKGSTANTANNTVVMGSSAQVSFDGDVAIGDNAQATGGNPMDPMDAALSAIAIGSGAQANFNNSVAIGHDAVVSGENEVRIGNYETGGAVSTVNWTIVSDGRFKTNIAEDVAGLDFINALRPVSYQLDRREMRKFTGSTKATNSDVSKKTMGFIAQEVARLVEEKGYTFTGVKSPKTENDHYGLRYAEFVVPLTKAVQELSALVEAQQQRIEAVESLLSNAGVNIGNGTHSGQD